MGEDEIGEVKLPHSLEDARVATLPPAAYYIPNFVTAAEENLLLNKVHLHTGSLNFLRSKVKTILMPSPQINTVPLPRWTHLTHRRLQTWPSALSSTNTLLASPLPAWLTDPIFQRFAYLGIFAESPHGAPNHCLVNEYKPGQGIMPHEDGAAYYPVVATVSLGSATVLDVYGRRESGEVENRPRHRILQERRSLLVTTGE
ncbi:MAG: hypothetical protein M1830_010808, partial [Pleopsidium flavum]